MPPMKRPMVVPIASRRSPPLSTSQVRPGRNDNAPTAARTIANSAIRAPKPRTPAIAAGTRGASAAIATITPAIAPMFIMSSREISILTSPRASITPWMRATTIPTKDLIRSGSRLAMPSKSPITKSNMASTIPGVNLTSDSSILNINSRQTSTIGGIHSRKTSSTASTNTVIALPIAGAPSMII